MPNLVKLRKRKTTFQKMAYESIRKEIIQGRLKWGQRLSEESLAGDLNISRTPVREAIFQLEKEGLVEKAPNKGFSVRELRSEDIEENFKLRSVLEPLVIELVLERMDQDLLRQLQKNIERSRRLLAGSDFESLMDVITEFHEILNRASGSPKLSSFLDGLGNDALIYRNLAVRKEGVLEDFVAHHEQLLQALIDGDRPLAEEIHMRHLQEAQHWATRALRAVPAPRSRKEEDEKVSKKKVRR